jgi:hypothetical protein
MVYEFSCCDCVYRMSVLVGNSLCQFSMGIVDGCVLFSLIYIVFIGVLLIGPNVVSWNIILGLDCVWFSDCSSYYSCLMSILVHP